MKTKKKNRFNPLLWPVIVLVLSAFMILNLLLPDRSFSQVENRSLAGFPAFSLQSMENGSTGKDLEKWYSDQFIGRNTFFHINYLIRKLCGQREINDVFLGRNQLLAQPEAMQKDAGAKNAQAAGNFASKSGIDTKVLVVPGAAIVQPQKLPLNAPVFDQMSQLSNSLGSLPEGVSIDAGALLQPYNEDYIFYKTDHHMTTYGAGLCASALTSAFGMSMDLSQYDLMPVSGSFQGTLASKTGSVFIRDSIDIAPAKNNPDYIVNWADGTRTGSIYNTSALKQKDQYQVFLGANQSVITVTTTADSDKHLLILKDSYANAMIQYLLPFYSSIVIVDPRYFYDDLDTLISAHDINEAAMIFSADTWLTQTKLYDVLQTLDALQTNQQS